MRSLHHKGRKSSDKRECRLVAATVGAAAVAAVGIAVDVDDFEMFAAIGALIVVDHLVLITCMNDNFFLRMAFYSSSMTEAYVQPTTLITTNYKLAIQSVIFNSFRQK